MSSRWTNRPERQWGASVRPTVDVIDYRIIPATSEFRLSTSCCETATDPSDWQTRLNRRLDPYRLAIGGTENDRVVVAERADTLKREIGCK